MHLSTVNRSLPPCGSSVGRSKGPDSMSEPSAAVFLEFAVFVVIVVIAIFVVIRAASGFILVIVFLIIVLLILIVARCAFIKIILRHSSVPPFVFGYTVIILER